MTIAHAACAFEYQCLPNDSTNVTFKTNSCGGSIFMDAFLHEFCRHFIEMNMLNALFCLIIFPVLWLNVGEFVILTDVQVRVLMASNVVNGETVVHPQLGGCCD